MCMPFRRRAFAGAFLFGLLAGATTLAHSDPSPATDNIDTVVVTGSPLPGDADSVATIVDSVDRDEILRRGGASLADALANEPGVSGTGFAPGASRPVIRGFDANRVRVLEDGIGSFDVSDVGPDHGVPVDPLSAQRIEVVRGPATLRYGSQAIGGVVNAINDRVPLKLPDEAFSADVNGAYGTNADMTLLSGLADARAGQFAVHADGFWRDAGDYATPGGTQQNSYFRGDGGALGSSWFFGEHRIGAGVIHYDSDYGIPGDTSHIEMHQTKELLRSAFAVNSTLQTLTVEGGHADYRHSEILPDGSIAATFRDHESDARAEGLFGSLGFFDSSALGVQVQDRNFSALGEGSDYLLPTHTRSGAVFAFSEASLGMKAKLQAGARVESLRITGTDATDRTLTRSFSPTSASLGVLADVSAPVRIGLTLTSAERAPAQTELFARGPHDGPGTYETGDAELGPERANSIELSLRYRSERYRFDGSLWGTHFDDYIYGALTGRTCDDAGVCALGGGDLKELDYVQGDATFRGAEAKSTWTLMQSEHGLLEAKLFADWVRATLASGGYVPRIPPWHAGVSLDLSRQQFATGATLRWTGRQDELFTGETPTGGFASVDAYGSWSTRADGKGLTFSLNAHNLTNSTQRNAIALNKDEIVLPGRDVQLAVRASF